MPMNNGGDTIDEVKNDAEQAIQTGKDIINAPQKIQQGVSTAKKAFKLAKSAPAAIKKAATAAKAAKNTGYIVAFFTTPPVLVKLIVVGLVILGLVIASLLNALNPFSTTNSPGGDNAEAQENDIAEDRGVDPDSVDDELMLNYPMDDEEDKDGNKVTGQYTRMASLLYEGINEAYGRSASKYATEKANYANDPQYKTHDNVNKVYIWPDDEKVDSDYHNAANSSGIGASHHYAKKSDKPTMGEVPELEGDSWDDGDYLTDQSQGGAVEQGIAYIIAAYSVSRGNTAPVAVEGGKNKYTYYNGLKAILKDDSVLDGFFEYSGGLDSVVKTSTVSIVKLKHTRKTVSDGNNLVCPYCYKNPASYPDDDIDNTDAKCTYQGSRIKEYSYGSYSVPKSEWARLRYVTVPDDDNTEPYTYRYVTIPCNSECSSHGTHTCVKYETRTATAIYEYIYKCPKCNREITGATTQEARNKLKPAEHTYWVWEEGSSQSKNFEYIQNSYKGNIAKFNDQKILEKMFLDDNDFYKDAQGQMAAGVPMGGAASITAGQSINLPAGLGRYFTYMGWQMITSPSSNQYKLRQAAGMNFDSEGFGIINGRYVIACTTTFGNVGDYVDFYQSDGTVLNCIIGDIKNQSDPGCTQWGHNNGDVVVEFVVDKSSWYPSHPNVGSQGFHMELSGKNIVKAVNGGNYFTNPDFVKDLKDSGNNGASGDSSDLQLKVANIAVNSAKNGPGAVYGQPNMCAAWVGDVYNAAGVNFTRQESAIDWWYKWGNPSQATASNIPVGAAVVGSGSNSAAGQAHGHIGIYVGDVDGDGKGDVVHNIGNPVPVLCSLESWIATRANTVTKKWGQNYQGYQGWVWPDGNALGSGVEFTGVDVSNLSYGNVNASNLSREQRLANIMASDYYQWGVNYKYTCNHPRSSETTCPECGADIKIKKEKFLFFTTNKIPDFEYVKNEFPDFLGKLKEDPEDKESMIDSSDVYTVREKIEYYQKDILDSIKVAKQYESNTAGGPAGNGGVNPGVGAGNVGGNIQYSGNGAADAAPYKFENPKNQREEMVNWALQFVGNPYEYGGDDLYHGIDCSHFVARVLRQFGYNASAPTGTLVNQGVGITYSEIKPGDIILYRPGNNHHVAMYIGNGRVVHASHSAPYPDGGIKIGNALMEPPLAIRRFIQD